VFEIDQLQVVIYVEGAGLNVSACLELAEKSQKGERELACLSHFWFDMGELTRVSLGYKDIFPGPMHKIIFQLRRSRPLHNLG
jgi:hypothetical protein